MPRRPHIDRRAPEIEPSAIQISSIGIWPAAGGGLLLGMIVTSLMGAAPPRRPVKTLFLKLDVENHVTVIVPYVRLEPDVQHCTADVIATELGVAPELITIDNRVAELRSYPGSAKPRSIADLDPACEMSLAFIAALARMLLTTAAADIWNIAARDCIVDQGLVRGNEAW